MDGEPRRRRRKQLTPMSGELDRAGGLDGSGAGSTNGSGRRPRRLPRGRRERSSSRGLRSSGRHGRLVAAGPSRRAPHGLQFRARPRCARLLSPTSSSARVPRALAFLHQTGQESEWYPTAPSTGAALNWSTVYELSACDDRDRPGARRFALGSRAQARQHADADGQPPERETEREADGQVDFEADEADEERDGPVAGA